MIIGIACLPATDANREREKRNPQGNLVCPDRNPSDYGLPYSQIATALREVHHAMQILNKVSFLCLSSIIFVDTTSSSHVYSKLSFVNTNRAIYDGKIFNVSDRGTVKDRQTDRQKLMGGLGSQK